MATNATPAETVNDFVAAFERGDPAELASYFSDDAVYHNIPMDPIEGREAIEATFGIFIGMFDTIRFEVLHQLAEGPLVMNERVDHFEKEGRTSSLPVTGVFEVREGRIRAWRDYFDMQQFTSQTAAVG